MPVMVSAFTSRSVRSKTVTSKQGSGRRVPAPGGKADRQSFDEPAPSRSGGESRPRWLSRDAVEIVNGYPGIHFVGGKGRGHRAKRRHRYLDMRPKQLRAIRHEKHCPGATLSIFRLRVPWTENCCVGDDLEKAPLGARDEMNDCDCDCERSAERMSGGFCREWQGRLGISDKRNQADGCDLVI
jgi:hypothetical protein